MAVLPPHQVLHVELDEEDRKAYDALYMCARRLFASLIVDEGNKNYTHILTILLRLRLLACHASLVPQVRRRGHMAIGQQGFDRS